MMTRARAATMIAGAIRLAAFCAVCAPACVVHAADLGVVAETGQNLGADAFDANKTTKYTVDATSGNLYVKQTDLVIPSQVGPSIEVVRTYNSRSFDYPRMFGAANWSCSLRKYLKTDSFVVCTDTGDLKDLSEGDMLEEAPEEQDCSDFLDAWDTIVGQIEDLEDRIIPAIEREISTARSEVSRLDGALYDAEGDRDGYQDLKDEWESLQSQPNCERDGWENYPACWMPDDDWGRYQELGGNGDFAYQQQLDAAEGVVAEIEGQIAEYVDEIIPGLEDDLDECNSTLTELQGAEPEIGDAYRECAGFDWGDFDDVPGYVFSDGDGDGCFVPKDWEYPDDPVPADTNTYHIAIDPAGGGGKGTVRLKDGTVYEFGGPTGGEHDTAVTRIADRHGNALVFTYNGDGTLDRVTDATGTRYVAFSYLNGRVIEVRDHTGRAVTYGYEGENLTKVTHPDGTVTRYEYWGDDEALLKKITDNIGHTVNFEYWWDERSPYENQWGRRIQQTKSACTRVWREGDGETIGDTHYSYNPDMNWWFLTNPDVGETQITDSRGYVTTKKWRKHVVPDQIWNKKRFVTEVVDPYNGVTRYTWDASAPERFGNLLATTDTNGLVHEMVYDRLGNMTSKTEDPGDPLTHRNYRTEWTYENVYNQVTMTRDARGNAKYNEYVTESGDPHGPIGVLWKETDAAGHVTEHWCNAHGQRERTHDANGFVTEYEYGDAWWNLTRSVKRSDSEYGHEIEGWREGGVVGFDASAAYDARGNKIREIDYNGNETNYIYNVMNRLMSKRVQARTTEYVTAYTYDSVGNRQTMTDPNGNVTTYHCDGADRLIEVDEPEERTISYGYDTEGNKTSETDPNGNVTVFDYDRLNRMVKKTEPLGRVTEYRYEGPGDSSTDGGSREYTRRKDRYTKMVQRNDDGRENIVSVVTKYGYDKVYRLEKVTDALNGETQYGYDAVGNKVRELDAEGRETLYDYDARNQLIKVTDAILPDRGTLEYEYDGMGNKVFAKDKNGHRTWYQYGDRNLLTRVTDELGNYVEYTHDGMNKRKEWDKRGYITEYTYDVRNLLRQTTLPTGGTITIWYDDNGNKTSEIDPNENTVKFEYDGMNRLTVKTDAYGALAGLTTGYGYDAVGNRTSITDGNGRVTQYHYDALNRLDRVTDAKLQATRYGYDTLGNKVWVIDARGYRTDYWYDVLNRLVRVRNPLGKETSYTYDAVGNRTDQYDAKGQHIRYVYDDLNRLATRTFVGLNESIGYGYDKQGNRTGLTDTRVGMEDIAYEYDELNRLTDVTYSPSGKTIHYEYDENGNRTVMTDAEDGDTNYYYDGLNRVDYLATADGTTDYTYDAGSRLTQMEYPNGTWTAYEYDAANRVLSIVTKNSSNEVIQSISYRNPDGTPAYDNVGNKLRMEDGAGVTTYGYDELYRLTGVTYPDGKAEVYVYDATGNRVEKRVNGAVAESYGYNEANQLITRVVGGGGAATRAITVTGTVLDASQPPFSGVESVTVNGVAAEVEGEGYTAEGVVLQSGENVLTAVARDRAGNESRSSVTVRYEPNAPTEHGYGYDLNGNMSRMEKRVGGQLVETTTYEYDYENRLTRVNLPNLTTNEFVYDGDKRRVSSTNAAGVTTKFLYDGLNNLKDYAGDGTTVLAAYVEGIGIDKLISRNDTSGTRYYHADALGSTRLMTDAAQATTASYQYDAWGKITAQSGESTNKFKFTAREFEDEIGLQYNRARFYDPETGRFITQDPLTGGPEDPTICYKNNIYSQVDRAIKEYIDGLEPSRRLNRYVYCANNPINLIDPLGLQSAILKPYRISRSSTYGESMDRDIAAIQEKITRGERTSNAIYVTGVVVQSTEELNNRPNYRKDGALGSFSSALESKLHDMLGIMVHLNKEDPNFFPISKGEKEKLQQVQKPNIPDLFKEIGLKGDIKDAHKPLDSETSSLKDQLKEMKAERLKMDKDGTSKMRIDECPLEPPPSKETQKSPISDAHEERTNASSSSIGQVKDTRTNSMSEPKEEPK